MTGVCRRFLQASTTNSRRVIRLQHAIFLPSPFKIINYPTIPYGTLSDDDCFDKQFGYAKSDAEGRNYFPFRCWLRFVSSTKPLAMSTVLLFFCSSGPVSSFHSSHRSPSAIFKFLSTFVKIRAIISSCFCPRQRRTATSVNTDIAHLIDTILTGNLSPQGAHSTGEQLPALTQEFLT
jgi:hypothetical protein